MTPRPEDHHDAAAYALGVLSPDDRGRFERHLAGCPRCAAELDGLAALTPLLADLAAESGPEPLPEPRPQLLDRLVAEVTAARRRGRIRRLALAACAAVLVVGGPAATWALTQPTAQVAVAQQQFTATDPGTGVSASIGVAPRAWGSEVTLALGGARGPLACELVAVAPDGARQTVTTWSVPADGYRDGPVRTTGGAALGPSGIDRFEVRTLDTGRLLVAVPAHG
ncbi:zf-HC2 domain-containing protein [Kitasatospora sp. NPDC048365]|uniref:zf-HC2 domain-containing protein n=1 Tax=Kitasatospora sp. NPDC048365 TaxID=3364050 RepID=UPI0037158929